MRPRAKSRRYRHPLAKVAILFAAIFITLTPVSDLMRLAASNLDPGARPAELFWLTGAVSAVLDNTPAYLVLFDLAGIDPTQLGQPQAAALRAISAGAVMFGGLTDIGNAPNLMARATASHLGLRTPGFVAFALWTSLVMLPVLTAVTSVFFRP